MCSSPIVKISSWGRRATTEVAASALLAVVSACGGSSLGARPDAVPGVSSPRQGQRIDFEFDSLDARAISAASTRGKPTVIAFVTTASLPAQAQVDFLVAMARHDADRVHYAVVALEASESRELVELYRKALSIPFPVAMADAPTLAGAGPFGDARAVPVTVVLDRTGRVVVRIEGRVAKSEELRATLRGL
jgi:hypothetical protein